MAKKIQVKRGAEVHLPALDVAELGFTIDTKKMFIGSADGNVEFPKKEYVDLELADKAEKLYVDAQLANKAEQSALIIEKDRINNIVANVGNTSGNTEIVDIRVGQDGKTYATAGDAVRQQLEVTQNNISNFNGYNLTRNKPISNDITTSITDGVYYVWGQHFTTAPPALATTYSGIVQGIVPGRKYRVTVYTMGEYTLNYLNFYTSSGTNITRDATKYGYKVVDEANKIIEVTAPPNASIMTYTNYLTNKSKGYCKAVLDKLSVDWLEVNSNNLDTNTKATLETINNAFTLTTNDKLSNSLIYLTEDGYFMGTTWSGRIVHATFGTAYFNAVEGNEYKMHVYSVTSIPGDFAVIYFWDKNNIRIAPATYQYTVVDEANMIIHITAPVGAVTGTLTYSPASGGKEAFFVYSLGGTHSYDWLVINKDNLSDEVRAKVFNDDDDVQLKYGHSLNKPFNFTGKTVTFFGDSITAGSTSPSLAVTPNPYCKIFADKFAMSSVNRAVGGSTICDTVSTNSILNKVLAYTDQRDFLWIAGGTNDWTLGKPIGVYSDTTGETFYGALRVMCEHLKTNHANSTVIFVTPINQNVSRPLSITTMDAYRNAIFEMATSYGFNVADGSQVGFPSDKGGFTDAVCSDGVHPSLLGHSFYAQSLSGILV